MVYDRGSDQLNTEVDIEVQVELLLSFEQLPRVPFCDNTPELSILFEEFGKEYYVISTSQLTGQKNSSKLLKCYFLYNQQTKKHAFSH